MISRFTDGASADSRKIREIVFIDEQGFKGEFDEYDEFATTLVIYDDEMHPMATGRLFETELHTFKLGRIAVLKEYRKLGLGSAIIKELETKAISMGAEKFLISAQCVATGFYKKCGYTTFGDTYFEEHVEHIMMQKNI